MKVFAPAPFRYPAITGQDYPYGHQEIADDSLARILIAAGKVLDATRPASGSGSTVTVVDNLTTSDPASALSANQGVVLKAAVDSVLSPYVAAPATLDASNAATFNGKPLSLAAGATLTMSDAAWALLGAGISIYVGQSGSATLAFSGTAVKENSSGTSATSVTLAASGMYTLTQSPSGSPKFRLAGGASL